MIEIVVARDFSPDLGGRYKKDGPFSGEAFRDAILIGRLERALRDAQTVTVTFDGVSGAPTSFLEEAFGGLLRKRPDWQVADLKRVLIIQAPHSPRLQPLMALAYDYMDKAAARREQT